MDSVPAVTVACNIGTDPELPDTVSVIYNDLSDDTSMELYAIVDGRELTAPFKLTTYAVMRRTPRYEIRLAAFFSDNLMNSVAHCGELPTNVVRPLRHIYELNAWLVT